MSNKKLSTSRWIGSIVLALLSTALLLIAACALEGSVDTVWGRKPGSGSGTYWTVKFDVNGGNPASAPADQMVVKGGYVNEPVFPPVRTGNDFTGWFKEQGATTLWDFYDEPVTKDTTLYAGWKALDTEEFSVIFITNGGTPPLFQINVSSGELVPDLLVPVKAGYTFEGWYKDNNLTPPAWVFDADTVTENTILYAKWKEIPEDKYGVIFDSKGGFPLLSQETVNKGASVTKPSPDPERTGYTLDGWYKNEDGTGPWNFTVDIVTNHTTLYAKWTPITYTVEYDKNAPDSLLEGVVVEGTTADSSHIFNEFKTLTPNGYTLDGWLFTGWNTNADGTGEDYPDKERVRNLSEEDGDTVTLYAMWTELITFGLLANGDDDTDTTEITITFSDPVPDLGIADLKIGGVQSDNGHIVAVDFDPDDDNIVYTLTVNPSATITGWVSIAVNNSAVVSKAQTVKVYKAGDVEVVLESIEITHMPTKTTYIEGELLDIAGLAVTAHFSDGSETPLAAGQYTLSPDVETPLATTHTEVTVSYTSGEDTEIDSFEITVSPAGGGEPAVDPPEAIKTANDVFTWVSTDVIGKASSQPNGVQYQDADNAITYLYFIHSKLGGNTITIDIPSTSGWSVASGGSSTVQISATDNTPVALTHSDGTSHHTLCLVPVAQYIIEVDTNVTGGKISINDGSPQVADVPSSAFSGAAIYYAIAYTGSNTITKTGDILIEVHDGNSTGTVVNPSNDSYTVSSKVYTIVVSPVGGGGPSEQELALDAIKTTDIKNWVQDNNVLSTVYPEDKNVEDAPPDEPRTHLYFIHSKTNNGSITINEQNGWSVDGGATFIVDSSIEITEKMLTHTSGAKYGLWLFPVAEYEIVFEPYTEGTIKITDGTSKSATIGPITASINGTSTTKHAIGVVNATTTIIVEKGGIAITVKDGGGTIVTNQDTPGTYTVTGTLASEVYTITASSTRLTSTDAMTFIEGTDIAEDWWLDPNILASYSQDINVNQADVEENPRTHLYFIHKNITNNSISFTPPDGWTIDGEDTVVVSETNITKKQLKYTAKDGFVTYWLWLVPVAQFNVVFENSAAGTIRITDGTDAGKTTTTNKSFIGMVRAENGDEVTAKITIESSSSNIGSISVKDQEGNSLGNDDIGESSGVYTFKYSITSQIYTVTVHPNS